MSGAPTGVAVVANPRAGGRRHPGRVEALAALCEGRARLCIPGSADAVEPQLAGLLDDRIEVLAVAGGDGTVSAVLSALGRLDPDGARWPRLCLLGGGTMNTIARTLAPTGAGPVETLDALLSAPEAGVLERATLRVDGRVGMLLSCGLMAAFLEEYYRRGEGRPTALTAATLLAGGALSSLWGGPTIRRIAAPLDGHLAIDGSSCGGERFLAVAAGTVDEVGLGFRAFPGASDELSSFRYLVLETDARRLALALPRLRRGQVDRDVGFAGRARHLSLDAGPQCYALDGNLHHADGPLEVTLGPRARFVQVVTPRGPW